MLNEGIIEENNSPYINPFIVLAKKSNEIRLCLDTKHFNEIIIPDFHCNME